MPEPSDLEFTKRSIVGVESADGTCSAKEMLIHRTSAGDLVITPVPGTERELPITREEAEMWIDRVLDNPSEEERRSKIEMLCCISEPVK